MDATCAIQDSIHVFSLVRKYVSRILGTYQISDDRAWVFYVRPAAHVSFARHGRALAGESPEHAQVVGNV